MMSNSTCSALADAAFGPAIAPSCRGGFDFTLLFEQSILTLVPASLFALAFPVRTFYLLKKKVKTLSSLARHAKLIATTAFAILQLTLVVLWARNDAARTVVSLPSAAVSLLVAILLVALSRFEDERSVRPSSLALGYLLVTLLFDMAQARSLWLHGNATAISAVFSASVGMKVALVFLEAQQKRTHLRAEYQALPPESISGIISRSFLWWINDLFRRGYRNLIPFNALYVLESELTSDHLGQKMQMAWNRRRRPERRFEYPLAVCCAFWWPLMEAAIPRLFLIGFMFAQPFLITRTLNLLGEEDNQMTANIGYGLIGAAALIYFGIAVSRLHYEYRFYRFLTMFRGASVSLIYDRTLQLQDGVYDESAAVTLMGTDIDRIALNITLLNECWARCIELAVGIYLLARQLGWICILPIVIVLVCSGASTIVSNQIGGRQKVWVDAIQKRISLTSSMLAEMRSVKMMGLSRLMTTIIQGQRVRETHLMGGYRWCIVWLNVIANTPAALVPAFAFAVYAIQATVRGSNSIGTTQAFTSLAIISLIIEPAGVLLSAIPSTAASLGCFDRIQKFLVAPPRIDVRHVRSSKSRLSSTSNSGTSRTDAGEGIEMQPVYATKEQEKMAEATAISMEETDIRPALDADILLKDICFSIAKGTVTMVVGPVACGKTTLLRGILGEVPLERGLTSVSSSRIAYCAQTPWLPNATIRDVICGPPGEIQDFDEQWYRSTIHACALEHDLALLPEGDKTEMGSGSTVLSGGQKHRVALARAVYARSDIVVLDDVLSALDATTKKTVMDRLLGNTGLLKRLGSTVVLVTHDVAYLSHADKVLVLADGRIQHEGTYEQIMRQGLIDAIHLSAHEHIDENEVQMDTITKMKSSKASKEHESNDLTRATGDVAVYRYYFSHFGWWKGFLFFLGVIMNVFCVAFSQIWLKWWTDVGGGQIALYITIYFLLSVFNILGTFLYIWAICVLIQVSTARKFHLVLLRTVMRASQAFFSVTDSGSVLNRFSQDMTLIEGQLPTGVLITVSNLFLSLAGAALIATGSTYMAATVPLLIAVIWGLQHVYLRTSRQLRLLDLEARSPLYSHFLETLSGLGTIRAFGWEVENREQNERLLDFSQRPYYLLYCVQRWLNLALDLIVAGEAVVVVGLALGLRTSTTAGLLGVSLNNILSFNQSLAAMVQGWTMMETSLGSIARLKDFEATVKPEDQGDKAEPPEHWPDEGVIEFRDITAAHNLSAIALNNVSFRVKSGQKVGICGRTGSGKSSLVGTLLGLLEIKGGTIVIDGVDLTTLSRDTVRERLVTLPQDPLILIGSVRLNADPASINDDSAIIEVLTKVGLWSVLSERGGLDAEITASTLSKGQQQLLALARALLKKGKILLLDEPTSNVDAETDKTMQRILREEFADCTILTVAHRLNTIIDSDVVLVLEGGRLAEMGNPQALLKTKDSLFSKLAKSSGAAKHDQ